jgi:hypothetical protein
MRRGATAWTPQFVVTCVFETGETT